MEPLWLSHGSAFTDSVIISGTGCGKRANWKWDINKHIRWVVTLFIHSLNWDCLNLKKEWSFQTSAPSTYFFFHQTPHFADCSWDLSLDNSGIFMYVVCYFIVVFYQSIPFPFLRVSLFHVSFFPRLIFFYAVSRAAFPFLAVLILLLFSFLVFLTSFY